jgi:hypothetical protein
MKRFGILALALTFMTGAVVTTSFAQDTTKDATTKKAKKKKAKKPADDTTKK